MSEPKYERYCVKPPSGLSRGLVVCIIAGMAIFIGLALYGDIGSVTSSFAEFKWAYIPLILGLTFLNYLLRFYKWDYYLKTLGIKLKGKDSLSIFLSGLAMSVTPGKLGEVFKCYLLKRWNGTEVSRSVPVVVAERITDVLGLLILAAISFSAFKYGTTLLVVVLALSLALVIVIKSRRVSYWLLERTKALPLLNRLSDSLAVAYESAHTIFGTKNLVVATSLSVLSWGFECLAMYFVLRGFGADASVMLSSFVFAFSSLAGAVSIIPGGLLVAEATSTGLLVLAGFSKTIAVSATMIIRVCTLWFGVLVGLTTLLFARRRTVGGVRSKGQVYEKATTGP